MIHEVSPLHAPVTAAAVVDAPRRRQRRQYFSRKFYDRLLNLRSNIHTYSQICMVSNGTR